MLLTRIQNTERHIIHSAGETTDHADYLITRAPQYPNWYQANMIELRVSGGRTLADWEAIFHEHFDRASFKHLMLYLPRVDGFEALHDEINTIMASDDRGEPELRVERITWMFASNPPDSTALPVGLEVRPVETEDDYEDLIQFGIDEMRDEPWATNDDDARRFLNSRREIVDRIGVRWLRLCAEGDRRILARLGIFKHGNVCRLQSVGTLKSHRRQGLGSALVKYAIADALTQGAEGLALSTETDSGAQSMYTNVGFRPVGHDLWAMRYPS